MKNLSFETYILIGLTFLFLLGMLAKIIWHDFEIFNACKTIIPPIATFIIGYCISKKYQ